MTHIVHIEVAQAQHGRWCWAFDIPGIGELICDREYRSADGCLEDAREFAQQHLFKVTKLRTAAEAGYTEQALLDDIKEERSWTNNLS